MAKPDWTHVIRNVYDETTNALRSTPSSSTSQELEISYESGDSIASVSRSTSHKNATDPIDIKDAESLTLYVSNDSDISSLQVKLEISPSDTDEVWLELTSVDTAGSAGSNKRSDTLRVSACRARLTFTSDESSKVTTYLVKKSC